MSLRRRTSNIIVGTVITLLIVVPLAYVVYASRANSTPNQVVTRFYDRWIKEERNGTSTPITEGLHLKSTYVTQVFGRTVAQAAAQGRDAVLCTGRMPAQFSTDPAQIAADDMTATVRFVADETVGYVTLVRGDWGWWRIDEVDCPVPESATPAPAGSTATDTPQAKG